MRQLVDGPVDDDGVRSVLHTIAGGARAGYAAPPLATQAGCRRRGPRPYQFDIVAKFPRTTAEFKRIIIGAEPGPVRELRSWPT
jgi:hypothetical protein